MCLPVQVRSAVSKSLWLRVGTWLTSEHNNFSLIAVVLVFMCLDVVMLRDDVAVVHPHLTFFLCFFRERVEGKKKRRVGGRKAERERKTM